MISATEAPSQAVVVLQYGLLACSPIGLAGSLVMYASQKGTLRSGASSA
jgi:hypothetical protein